MREWTTGAWREEVLAWVEEQGVRPHGQVTQPRLKPWSTSLRIPTHDGVVWFKAAGPGCAFEARLLRALTAYATPYVIRPMAVEPDRGWLLLPDGGPTLRDRGTSLADWEALLPRYAELQRSLEHRALPGADDLRPSVLPSVLDVLLTSVAVDPLDELRALRPRFASWCEELTGSGVLPTLQHDDLHDNNVFASGVIFDWGDACLGTPFASLLVVLRSVASSFGLAPGDAALARLRDAYLEAWTDRHSRVELELLALLATRVAKVGRAVAWQRALRGVDDPGEHAEAVAGWLEELLEEDVF